MVFAGERCFQFHRIILIAMGLWPYQKPFIWRIQAIFFFGVFFCLFWSQALTFLAMSCNLDCILKRFSYVCICSIFILNYYSLYFNSEMFKRSLQHLHFDWKMFENSDAMKIFEEYLFEAYIFIVFLIVFVVLSTIIFVTFECRSVILDIILPMNDSRPRKVELELQLFVDEEQYFFFYLTHEVLGVFIGFWAVIATSVFLVIVGKHASATYEIASCLIDNTATVRTLQIPAAERLQFMYRNIRLSIHIHRRTLEFCSDLSISFSSWLFPIIVIGVASLSCILFRFYNALMELNNFYDILTCSVLLGFYLFYMFMANLGAQSYTEHSGKILEATYNSLWYTAPLPIQKLFLIMQKSIKNHKIIVGGLFIASIEGFSSLITAAVSYFTFMHAMQSLPS